VFQNEVLPSTRENTVKRENLILQLYKYFREEERSVEDRSEGEGEEELRKESRRFKPNEHRSSLSTLPGVSSAGARKLPEGER